MRSKKAASHAHPAAKFSRPAAWIEEETAGCHFRDGRLATRFGKLLDMIAGGIGETIPAACQDWANTKAAYRFFANGRVSEAEILAGHLAATRQRCGLAGGRLLILHDTCEFSYARQQDSAVGLIGRFSSGKKPDGRERLHTVRGILMHSSLAITPEGLPLGLTAVKFWTRQQFKGCNALKRKINPTRVPIEQKESFRWLENVRQSAALLGQPQDRVHIGDRESDIYELFCAAQELGTGFLVRTCVDRLAEAGDGTVAEVMADAKVKGVHRIQARNATGEFYEAVLELKYQRLRIRPPVGKQQNYPELMLTVIHALERDTPSGRERIEWKLLTNLPVTSRQEAVEKLDWYALRWKIETFHKILKSGCKAEESKLRASERLVNLLAVFCIIGWRVFWLTMVFRVNPEQPPEVAFTRTERALLDKLIGFGPGDGQRCLGHYLIKVAQLGGYLARASDAPPGNMVMWRGFSRLTDIHLGYLLAQGDVGN